MMKREIFILSLLFCVIYINGQEEPVGEDVSVGAAEPEMVDLPDIEPPQPPEEPVGEDVPEMADLPELPPPSQEPVGEDVSVGAAEPEMADLPDIEPPQPSEEPVGEDVPEMADLPEPPPPSQEPVDEGVPLGGAEPEMVALSDIGPPPPSTCGCRVGFSAYMTNSSATAQSLSMVIGKTLVFDRITANTGQYSTINGRFRAPSSGTYAFTWTICVDSRYTDGGAFNYGEYGTQLMNGRGVCGYLHTDTERRSDDACSTAFVLCRVLVNNYVYLRNVYAHQGRILSRDGHTRSTFSGWKVFD